MYGYHYNLSDVVPPIKLHITEGGTLIGLPQAVLGRHLFLPTSIIFFSLSCDFFSLFCHFYHFPTYLLLSFISISSTLYWKSTPLMCSVSCLSTKLCSIYFQIALTFPHSFSHIFSWIPSSHFLSTFCCHFSCNFP